MNNDYSFRNFDGEDCSSKGRCTLSPGIVSLQELVFYFIKQASYYIIQLENLNLYNVKIKDEIINHIASLIYIDEYSEKQMYELVMRCYYIYINSKSRYIEECNQNGIIPDIKKDNLNFNQNFTLTKSILSGDILIKNLYNKIPYENRNFSQILSAILKSVCQNISRLFDLKYKDDETVLKILNLLSIWNDSETDKKLLSEYINFFAITDEKLQLKLVHFLFQNYGSISEVLLSHSTRKGKCILVSGSNFYELMEILETTKDLDIDIYTHSNLLISNAIDKFRKYPHLRGHYSKNSENCIVDYATFPGAILLTKNSKNNTEYLYRGKIYSNDYITPLGVVKIENNNFTPLIETALKSVGFKKGRLKPDTKLGFNEKDVDNLIQKIISRLQNGKIKRLYIIGINSFSEVQKEYFEIFLSHLRSDEFCISFSYESTKNNTVTINIGNYTPLLTYLLQKLININSKNRVYFMFPICDVVSVSSIIRLKNQGWNNIFISSCSPAVINPSVFETFKNTYKINIATDAVTDLRDIRKNISQ